jgi:hypothetical protein
MIRPRAGGEQPYPEPADPPSAPQEAPPIDAPQEEPPSTPFEDGGRTIDADPAEHHSVLRDCIPSIGDELVA